jgi:hypothetical protein
VAEIVHRAAPDGRTCSRCGAPLVTGPTSPAFLSGASVWEERTPDRDDGGRVFGYAKAFWSTARLPTCRRADAA